MRSPGDEAGDVRDVGDEDRAGLAGDLRERREGDRARDRRAPAQDDLRTLPPGQVPYLVHVDPAGLAADTVAHRAQPLAGDRHRRPGGQMATARELERQKGVTGLHERQVHGEVGGRAGVRLHVGVRDAEQRAGAGLGQLLHRVHDLLTLVVALARVALGVFVGEHRPGGLEHGRRDVVLRRDEPELVVLAGGLRLDEVGDVGVGGGEMGDGRLVHGASWRRPAPRRAVPDLLRSPVVLHRDAPVTRSPMVAGPAVDPRASGTGVHTEKTRYAPKRAPGPVQDVLVAGALHGGLDRGPLVAELGEGLFEDGLAVGVAAPLLHVREMRLVRLVARRRRGVLRVLAGVESAPGAFPLGRYGDVGRKARPGLVPVRAVERHPHARRGFTTLGLSHRAGTDTAAPNGVATTHGLLLAIPAAATRTRRPSNTAGMPTLFGQPWWPCANRRPRAMIDTNQMTPVPIVSRSRLRSISDDSPSDELIPPPNRSDRPPPLPLWRRTSNTISELVMMRTMEVPMLTEVQRFRDSARRVRGIFAYSGHPFRGYVSTPACLSRNAQSSGRDQASRSRNRQILMNSPASRLAPPTRAPSMSASAMIPPMLSPLTEPP